MGVFFNGKCNSKARLDGKTVVITGSNTGIGKYTALHLYSRGARVIMACRNLDKAEEAVNFIKDRLQHTKGTGEIVVRHLELSSFSSVRTCAKELLQEEDNIHILINNAGVSMTPKMLSEDGYELQFATNHLGHFLFTLLLLPRILRSAPARIVNVSSIAHMGGDLYLDDINLDESYEPLKSYMRSKLANVLFTKELAKKLEGTGVTTYAVHPGVVATELYRNMDNSYFCGLTCLTDFFSPLLAKTAPSGAQTTLHCVLDEKAGQESGQYYDDCEVKTPSKKARNPELAKKLWEISIEMVKLGDYDPFREG